ncbi:hypothetical protein IMG5_175820 [Ichthyophthirius multifiliis]|uniref:UTP-monosaccharide-1-phosphate uridylyltransferase n=1 Tax=Ichthyophthirius multifiliis TaxID=5932 RepID=G0R280_ICHMU|nr:hypothetical protein IMG5_175820 [Ichthyophthirius multifiliis]EGR28427.1 hypothetical protein IMG5_175820 [Ichthyophthirius multifiliis]|eukprot:XP_004029663.1 hypothetical protein IMG5_175820 [Ichthyophthirius multifiliis]
MILKSIIEVQQFIESIGQSHLLKDFNKYNSQQQQEFIDQINKLNQTYPGGLKEYTERAKKLLKEACENVNPYEGFQPEVPVGQQINFSSFEEVEKYESVGREELRSTGFVLVAGGLGERLGYQGIKIGIPIELTTRQTFLEYYMDFIKAYGNETELAIMTSDDTYKLTIELLEKNNYFNFPKERLTIMKQEKVPAMLDNDARFAQIPNSLLIETKPHGHGDVHTLLHQHKLTEKWLKQGKKWVIFFQDTNPLVFRSLPSVLGVSKSKNLEVNSITVPRKPGEAVGAICKLVGKDNFSLNEYHHTLEKTKGNISEFINPKYADASKTVFKSATRLECMMQDYPKLLDSGDRVGFTQVARNFCFSTCKNDIKTAQQKFIQNMPAECASVLDSFVFDQNSLKNLNELIIDGQFGLPNNCQSKEKYRKFVPIGQDAPQYLQIRGYDVV